MRIVTWNCRVGGFRKKAMHIAPLQPDILAVQEVEPLDDVLLFAGECQPTYRDRPNFKMFPTRSTGMFSYTDMKLRAVADPDQEDWRFAFRRYETHDQSFQVVGVWTYATQTKKDSYRQAHRGIKEHREWIKSRPTVVLGDFNNTAAYNNYGGEELQELIESLGLVSAYHHHFPNEKFGKETRPTHFHKGKETAAFHLDYCFIPRDWAHRITSVEVGKYSDWHTLSDHVPLIVDLR